MSYSPDLRRRVVDAILMGMPRAEAMTTFQVGRTTITRWLRAYRASGQVAPTPPPGHQPHIPSAEHPALQAQLAAHPDATLAQHVDLWHANQGVRVSRWTMSRAIAAVGWTRKKRR
jgi:transposase